MCHQDFSVSRKKFQLKVCHSSKKVRTTLSYSMRQKNYELFQKKPFLIHIFSMKKLVLLVVLLSNKYMKNHDFSHILVNCSWKNCTKSMIISPNVCLYVVNNWAEFQIFWVTPSYILMLEYKTTVKWFSLLSKFQAEIPKLRVIRLSFNDCKL